MYPSNWLLYTQISPFRFWHQMRLRNIFCNFLRDDNMTEIWLMSFFCYFENWTKRNTLLWILPVFIDLIVILFRILNLIHSHVGPNLVNNALMMWGSRCYEILCSFLLFFIRFYVFSWLILFLHLQNVTVCIQHSNCFIDYYGVYKAFEMCDSRIMVTFVSQMFYLMHRSGWVHIRKY